MEEMLDSDRLQPVAHLWGRERELKSLEPRVVEYHVEENVAIIVNASFGPRLH